MTMRSRFVEFAKPVVAEFVPGAEVLEEHRDETAAMEVDDGEDSDESLDISDVDTDDDDSEEEPAPNKSDEKTEDVDADDDSGDEEDDSGEWVTDS
ncbi:hypothetical protein OESDEN_13348, partial [Oesophagostomum dentatum]